MIDPNRFMAKVVAGSMVCANIPGMTVEPRRTMTFEVPEGFDIEIGAVWVLTKQSVLPTAGEHS